MVEENSPHIIQMAIEREQTPPSLIGPDLDFVVVSPRNEKRLRFVEVDASYRAVMLLKSVYQRSHTIVPQLNRGGVQGHKDPWSVNNQH